MSCSGQSSSKSNDFATAAHLAERQYRHSEPENHLVATELESRWETALRQLQNAEETLAIKQQQNQCWAIPADLLKMLKKIGPAIPELWEQGILSWSQKKSLFRALVDKVVLRRNNDQVAMRIVWRGGDVTEEAITITVGRFEQLSHAKEIEEIIVAMAKQRQTDKQVATHLTHAGHRSPRSDRFLPSTVARIRMEHGILHKEGPGRPSHNPWPSPSKPASKATENQNRTGSMIASTTAPSRSKKREIQHLHLPDHPHTLEQFKQLVSGTVKTLAF